MSTKLEELARASVRESMRRLTTSEMLKLLSDMAFRVNFRDEQCLLYAAMERLEKLDPEPSKDGGT